MGPFPEYDHYDALGLAELVRNGHVTPGEICDEAIGCIERMNPKINAVILHAFESARKTARDTRLKGPFAGVPFLTRDLLTSYTGVPLNTMDTAGGQFLSRCESELTRRLKAAGVVILGETNTPGSCLSVCNSARFPGPARNPWNLACEPGGSGGGSAAAVCSGMVPMASGGDACGSIRIPASCCGLFGLKPTRGRTPTGPHQGEIWQGAYAEHVITRSVRDSAAMLDAIQGADLGAPYVIPEPERPYLEEIGRDPGILNIGFTRFSPLDTEVHPECVRAVEQAALLLMSLGHRVEEAWPSIDGPAMAKSFFTVHFSETSADISEARAVLGRKPAASDFQDPVWLFKLLGDVFSASDLVRSLRQWNTISRQMGVFFQRFDLFLTPTCAFGPSRYGKKGANPLEKLLGKVVDQFSRGDFLSVKSVIDDLAVESMAENPFTPVANIAGLPAMSVPLHWTAEGLPCGVQFTGRFGDEATLLSLAAQLEKAQPWFHRRPPVDLQPGTSPECIQEAGSI